ncbi:UbiA prenyltransferase family [Xylaria curta]|nr:UbiA prenyltransferase family [Xylaria curta]
MYLLKPLKLKKLAHLVLFHAHTLWLFTLSDIKTIVIPSTLFGLANALAAPIFEIPNAQELDFLYLSRKLPSVILWVWLNLLPFNINNQRTQLAIEEDKVNKPWRPIPSGRISSDQAGIVMLVAHVIVQGASIFFSCGVQQAAALVVLGVWYNNLGGADYHPLVRNAINALGYICFTSGAMEVAIGRPLPIFSKDSILLKWLGIIAAIIFTTVHTQDMYDQKGDALRGRLTVPIVIGDCLARWMIACWLVIWGLSCPQFWAVSYIAWTGSVGMAVLIAFRTLTFRDVLSDKTTFVIWNVWISLVYVLPIWKLCEV